MGLFDGTPLERPVLCERCGLDVKQCKCEPLKTPEPEVEPNKQRLQIRVEKRKRGKLMTVVSGFSGTDSQRQSVLKRLKDYCGAGGTLADGNVELQGDHVQRAAGFLRGEGYRV